MSSDPQPNENDLRPMEPPDDVTGLPGFRSWKRVYLLVVAVFIVYVIVMVAFQKAFS